MSGSPVCFYDGHDYDVGRSIGHRLVVLMQLMRREVEQRMARLDLTDAQWKPLWALHLGRATTPLELARELDIDAGAMTRLLDRLVAKGLVERQRSDADRRVVLLSLTAAGREVAAQVPHVLAAVNNDFLRGIDEGEWQQLLDVLERLVANGRALAQGEPAADDTAGAARLEAPAFSFPFPFPFPGPGDRVAGALRPLTPAPTNDRPPRAVR
jgi:DNA-binding MarR family transcriptional regulator